jgi:hypothetical protein
LFGKIHFLARGGFVGLVIVMMKGADNFEALRIEAAALYGLGDYRAALAKLRPALAASQKNGDYVNAVCVLLMMIRCHEALHEVS